MFVKKNVRIFAVKQDRT